MDWTGEMVLAHYRDVHSQICADYFVSNYHVRAILKVGYMRDMTQAKPFRERAPRVQAPFDAVEAALNERRRERHREAQERYAMVPQPREFRECPAWRRAVKLRSAVGLWVEPHHMHPRATVRAVWYGRDRRLSDLVVRKARPARPIDARPIAWGDIKVRPVADDGTSGPTFAKAR